MKRIFDFVLAIFLSIIFLIPMIIIAILIKQDSEGPVFFIQERTGKNGKSFKMYKFRTMIEETEKNNRILTHEERVTKLGEKLRKSSLDEIPQIINVIKGEMSFIGPRPWLPEYYECLKEDQKKRTSVLPGISGLAQVKGRNGLTIFEKLAYDLEYIDNHSFIRDLKLVGLTIITIFKREHCEINQECINDELELLKAAEKR